MQQFNFVEHDGTFDMTHTMLIDLEVLLAENISDYECSVKDGYFIASKLDHEQSDNMEEKLIYFSTGDMNSYRIHHITNVYSNIETKESKPTEQVKESIWDLNQTIRIEEVSFMKEKMNRKVAVTQRDFFRRGSDVGTVDGMMYKDIRDMYSANLLDTTFYNYDYPIINGGINIKPVNDEIYRDSLGMLMGEERTRHKN